MAMHDLYEHTLVRDIMQQQDI